LGGGGNVLPPRGAPSSWSRKSCSSLIRTPARTFRHSASTWNAGKPRGSRYKPGSGAQESPSRIAGQWVNPDGPSILRAKP
jgi:hypothetical protein